jgi:hypothetical protein
MGSGRFESATTEEVYAENPSHNFRSLSLFAVSLFLPFLLQLPDKNGGNNTVRLHRLGLSLLLFVSKEFPSLGTDVLQ